MIGRRIYRIEEVLVLRNGDYGFDSKAGYWVAKSPNGLVAGLKNHKVLEHEDGTITVSPSILVKGYSFESETELIWHGFLEKGIWREA